MSVIGSAKPKEGSRVGPILRADGHREYTEGYIVRSTITNEKGEVILGADGLPRIGRPYRTDAGALCNRLSPQQEGENGTVWEVQAQWTTDLSAGDPDDLTKPPLQRRLIYRWSTRSVEIYPLWDRKGKPFVNAVDDPFDPPPAMFTSNLILHVQGNYSGFSPALARQYENAVNSSPFLSVFPKYTCKITDINAQPEFGQAIPYWIVSYEIEITEDLKGLRWHPIYVLNEGPRYIDGDTRLKVLARDDHDVATGRNALLDLEGFDLPDGAAPTYLEFKRFPLRSFAPLGLG